jgi:hypothetical protein
MGMGWDGMDKESTGRREGARTFDVALSEQGIIQRRSPSWWSAAVSSQSLLTLAGANDDTTTARIGSWRPHSPAILLLF